MQKYVMLMKLTEYGIKNIKEAPERINAGIKAFEEMGGQLIGFYIVMGDYDYVAIGEAPSGKVAATFALSVGSLGNVKTTTLQAYTEEEFAAMVKKLP